MIAKSGARIPTRYNPSGIMHAFDLVPVVALR